MVVCERKNGLYNNFDHNLSNDRFFFISASSYKLTKYDQDNSRYEIPEMF